MGKIWNFIKNKVYFKHKNIKNKNIGVHTMENTLIYSDGPDLNVTVADNEGDARSGRGTMNPQLAASLAAKQGAGKVNPLANQQLKAPPQKLSPTSIQPSMMPPNNQQNIPQYSVPPTGMPQQNPYIQQPQYAPQPPYMQPQQPPIQDPYYQGGYYPPQDNNIQPALPNYELILLNNIYHLYIDLPGLNKNDIKTNFASNLLTISGVRQSMCEVLKNKAKGKKGKKPEYQAQAYMPAFMLGKFSFTFTFDRYVDEKNISADYVNGILHITLGLLSSVSGISVSIG